MVKATPETFSPCQCIIPANTVAHAKLAFITPKYTEQNKKDSCLAFFTSA